MRNIYSLPELRDLILVGKTNVVYINKWLSDQSTREVSRKNL